MQSLTPETIADRKAAIAAEKAAAAERFKATIAALDAEMSDLDAAARVLARLGRTVAAPLHDPGPFSPPDPPQEGNSPGSKRPPGVPKLPDMILTVLREAKERGVMEMEPRQIRSEIMTRWWPEVKENSVGSVAWRMWKNKVLEKDSALYSLPKEETPSIKELF